MNYILLAFLTFAPAAFATCPEIPKFTVSLNQAVDADSIEALRSSMERLIKIRFKAEAEYFFSPLVFEDLADPYRFTVTVKPTETEFDWVVERVLQGLALAYDKAACR